MEADRSRISRIYVCGPGFANFMHARRSRAGPRLGMDDKVILVMDDEEEAEERKKEEKKKEEEDEKIKAWQQRVAEGIRRYGYSKWRKMDLERKAKEEWEAAGGENWEEEKERRRKEEAEKKEHDRIADHVEVRNGMLEWREENRNNGPPSHLHRDRPSLSVAKCPRLA